MSLLAKDQILQKNFQPEEVQLECFDPTIRIFVEVASKKYLVNARYYVVDFHSWDEGLRDYLAARENLTLGEEHLHVIEMLRKEYEQRPKHPSLRAVAALLAESLGSDKGTIKYFHTLFPKGIHQAFLIAGVPMQDSCC